MITLQALFQHLNALLKVEMFVDSCPNGIQVEGKEQIRKIAFAVSASDAAIQAAVDAHADALIVHHGIFWNKDPMTICGIKKQKIAKLIRNEMSLIAYHLPLDAHREVGNNWKAAMDLGWENLQPFGQFNQMAIGVKGTFPPIDFNHFRKKLETYYGHVAHVAPGGPESVSSAAIVSGGAHWTILQAADEQVDCFITGSFDEPIWDVAHERKIHFLALGHYATERAGVLALCDHVHAAFGVECCFLDLSNPF